MSFTAERNLKVELTTGRHSRGIFGDTGEDIRAKFSPNSIIHEEQRNIRSGRMKRLWEDKKSLRSHSVYRLLSKKIKLYGDNY